MKRLLAAVAGLALVAGMPAAASATDADSITVVAPVVRLAPPSALATGAFMVLRNSSDKDIKLVKASSPVAKVAELHTHINDGGIMKMRPVPAIDIKAKGEAVLKPGGLHVMLINLNQPLKEGDKVAITLGFEDGSSKEIEAPVVKPMPMPEMPMDHMAPKK
jgi:periplasmic copper chaperone A